MANLPMPIADIVKLALDAKDTPAGLHEQFAFIEEGSREHTGVGMYVYFKHQPGIESHRLEDDSPWEGPSLERPGMAGYATTMIHLKGGIVDNLEIYAVEGVFPTDEIIDYSLKQTWIGSARKWIRMSNGVRTSGAAGVFEAFTNQGLRLIGADQDILKRAARIKAVLFDWDGVFNNGFKDLQGGSPFSEVDSMGVNLLRFALWLKNGERLPAAGIITGQHNQYAERFTQRERMHGCYMGYTNKPDAFDAFLAAHQLRAEEVAFFFDDVLDLPVAERCGLRVLIGRKASPWFEEACMGNVDVITACDGGHHGLREACELLIVATGRGEEVLDHRVRYSDVYQRYLGHRQAIVPSLMLKDR